MAAEAFRAYYPQVLSLVESAITPITTEPLRRYCLELLQHSTVGGKHSRGISACSAYLELANISPTSPAAEVGFLIGWALEIVQAAFLVADDLMDHSETRRGQICWYRKPGVGRYAAVDALLVENFAQILIDATGRFLPAAVVDHLTEKVRLTNTITSFGQTFDTCVSIHSLACYDVVARSKTAYYTIWQPIVSGMIASQAIPEDLLTPPALTKFLLELGHFFQVQDDYLDVYGDPAVTGKVGTDIIDGKVTWLSCTALNLANAQQKAELARSLGVDEPRVREIYRELDVVGAYTRYEEATSEDLGRQLAALDPIYPKKTLENLLKSLTKRRA
jgi:farnesyl diphosphate synthase